MAAKRKKRTARKAGELPGTMTAARVERTLDALGVKKSDFLKAYEESAGQRGRGVSEPPKKALDAYGVYVKNGDFADFCDAAGVDAAKGATMLARCLRWTAEKG